MAKVGKIIFKMPFSKFTLCSRLFVICVLLSCSLASSAAPRIVGGEEVESENADSRYPWMVSLRDVNTGSHICGGTLIDKKWVLSASHCYFERSAHSLVAVLGDYDLSLLEETEQRVDIARRVESGRDLVLMELATEVDISVFPPLRLADSSLMESVSVGDNLEIIGWGDRAIGSGVDTPTRLHTASIPMISNNVCAESYPLGIEKFFEEGFYDEIYGAEIDEKHICTMVGENDSEAGRSACQGDSGGPLLYESVGQLVQVGITSFGLVSCDFSQPDVNTRVSAFYEWIQDTINQRELSVSSLSLSDMVVSIIDEIDSETGEVTYELESIDTHELSVKNDSSSTVSVESIELELVNNFVLDDPTTEEVEGQKQALFDERFIDRVTINTSETEILQCAGAQLEAGESCQVRLDSLFVNAGPKVILLKLNVSGLDDPITFELTGNVLSRADFSTTFAKSSYLFQQRSNEWQTAYSINLAEDQADETAGVTKADFTVDEVSGAEVLISSLEDYDQTRLIAKLKGSGTFHFDWFMEHVGIQEFSVYLNGEFVKALDVQALYVRDFILIEDEGINSVEFRLSQGDEWPTSKAGESEARQFKAYLKGMSFDSNNPEEAAESETKTESDSGGGVGNLTIMVMLLLFSSVRRRLSAGGWL